MENGKTRWLWFGSAWVVVASVALACSGGSATVANAPIDAGGTSPEGNSVGSATYTLDDVCDRLAPRVCESRRRCCTSGPGYDEAACLAHTKAECAKDVAETRAGREDFHPDRIDACIPKLEAILASTCALTIDETLGKAAEIFGCALFTGHLAENTPCERDSQCTPAGPPTPVMEKLRVTSCDPDVKLCKTATVIAEGMLCALASGGSAAFCERGSYCRSIANTTTGTCQKRKETSEACTDPFECGLGNTCVTGTHVCAPGKESGPCANALECASLACEGDAGACKPLAPVVKREECLGP